MKKRFCDLREDVTNFMDIKGDEKQLVHALHGENQAFHCKPS